MSQYQHTNHFQKQQQQDYYTRNINNNKSIDSPNNNNKQTQIKESTIQYYPIQDRVQYVQSRIVSENNSIMMSNINNSINSNNRINVFQVSAQQYNQHQKRQFNQNNSNMLPQQSNITTNRPITNNINNNYNNNSLSLQSYQQPMRTNKLQLVSDNNNNNSIMSNKNSQSSLNKRSQSINRGGIRVLSKNSSIQKNSSTSQQKSINNGDNKDKDNKDNHQHQHLNKQNKKDNQTGLTNMCGLNCKTRSPFIQAQQNNQRTIIPNLGSIETLRSQFIDKQMYSDRLNYKLNTKNSSLVLGKNINTNSSQMTNIEQSNGYMTGNGNNRNNGNNQQQQSQQSTQKVYKHLRQLMQKQLQVSKKMYEKKCIDEIESMNVLYQTKIETLQKVLAQNQTLIEHQSKKIQKLQDKCVKHKDKINTYGERLQSINKYIQSTNKYTIQRLNETEKKFTLLLTQFHQLNITQHQSTIFTNKLQHLQTIFTTLITQTVMKYRNIQFQIKQQVKDMMKKYDYFQQKIYQMDLMKHLGKENQIQNYKLIEKIQNIKEQIGLIEKKNNIKTQVNMYKSTQENNVNQLKNISQFNELKNTLYKLQAQSQFWQKNQQQTFTQINKLQVDKYRLNNKINQLNDLVNKYQIQIDNLKQQNEKLRRQHINKVQQQQNHEYSQQKTHPQSGQKFIQSQQKQYEFSSEKKSTYQTQQQINNYKHTKQLQRLHEIIDQYQNKIQHLHTAIQQLQIENNNLHQEINKNKISIEEENNKISIQEEKNKISIQEEKNKTQLIDQSVIIKLNNIIEQKQNQLQQAIQTLQQTTKQKQQLNHALQMTQHIFDQQIQKFKQTIQRLQDQNQQLLYQLNDLRDSQHHMADSSSSSLSTMKQAQNGKKIVLSKSPKKQLCETVTMGWFKKNVQQNEHVTKQQNKKVLIRQVLSPQQSSKYIHTDRSYIDNSLSPSKDEFYYPIQNPQRNHYNQQHNQHNQHSRQQSIKSSYSMRSNNSNPQYQKSQQQQVGSKRKIQGYYQKNNINQVKHSQSLPTGGYIDTINRSSTNNKIDKLHQALTKGDYNCPVECILDSQGRLQLSTTGKYIVDQNYTTFQLSSQQLKIAQQLGLIYLVDQNIDVNEQQEQQQQQQHYIF